MTARLPLVLGDDALAQQLQAGDSLALGSPLALASGGTGRSNAMPVLLASGSSSTYIGQSYSTVVIPSVQLDSAAAYSTSGGNYTVPETGIYEVQGSIRLPDGVSPGVSWGVGVAIDLSGNTFTMLWGTTAGTRNKLSIRRLMSLTVNNALRLVGYFDSASAQLTGDAELQVLRVR